MGCLPGMSRLTSSPKISIRVKESAMRNVLRALWGTVLFSLAFAAMAEFHTYQIEELYSNADGSVQYLVMHESQGMNGENLWLGNALVATPTQGGMPKTFIFPHN